MMEAKLVLASAVQRFRFEPTPETEVRLFPSVTLRPRGGVRLRIVEPARRERLAGERRERQAGADRVDVVAG